jgi:hypothetical protein
VRGVFTDRAEDCRYGAAASRVVWTVVSLGIMKRLLALLAAVVLLVAATPDEILSSLRADGYYIESGSSATAQVVSNAVFDGRADGGRLYIVVLADEPPGGATTFADSTLDLLEEGYVVVVAPETVGYAGDSTAWSADDMNAAVDASLDGGTDDEVVDLFIMRLTGAPVTPPNGGPSGGDTSGGGFSVLWLVVIGAAVLGVFMLIASRNKTRKARSRMAHVKSLAKEKLNEVANDILEMEDEVSTSGDPEVQGHYQRASALYSEAMDANDHAGTVETMMKVSENLDLAIWELDCAEAILDGKPEPPKPKPPTVEPVTSSPVPEGHGEPAPSGTVPDFDRRPQRQSTGSGDMLNVLLTMMAMGSMRNRRGGFGGFGGSSGGWTGGGGRIGGGGGRIGGGGRFRGGGRRR